MEIHDRAHSSPPLWRSAWYRVSTVDADTKTTPATSGTSGAASGPGVAGDPLHDTVLKLCREVFSPLVRADGGVLYVVSVSAQDIHIHLAGTCAGCPGAAITRDRMIEPALLRVAPKAKLRVSTGWRIPEGSERIGEEPVG